MIFLLNASDHSRKNMPAKSRNTVLAALTTFLSSRLAGHACMWHLPLQQGHVSTQNPHTMFDNRVLPEPHNKYECHLALKTQG